MTDHDQLLQRALRVEGDAVRAEPDWDDVRRRARQSRPAGPFRFAAVAAVLALVALVAGILATRGGDDTAGVVADQPAPTISAPPTSAGDGPTTVPSELPETTWTVDPGPEVPPLLDDVPGGAPLAEDHVVAAVEVPAGDDPSSVDVVVLSKISGAVVRTIGTDYGTAEGGVYGIVVSPDRTRVFWVFATSACTSRIDVAPADGSAPPTVFREDASGIAFGAGAFAIETGEECQRRATVEVGPLAGGPTTVYTAPADDVTTLASMAVDEDHLYVIPSGSSGGPSVELHVVDRTSGSAPVLADDFSHLISSPGGAEPGAEDPVHVLVGGAIAHLAGTEVADIRVEVPDATSTALYSAGNLVVVVEEDGQRVLRVDGREIRRGVITIGG